jgi:arylsulfatase A-like enzyme
MNLPNIIFILTDDLGYGDLSCYGQQTWKTPNLDKMATEGLRFTDFYSTSPVCSPARASIMTGLHSGHLPIRQLPDPYLPDDIPTIPNLLKTKGYTSACIGKYGVGNGQPHADALKKGFDYHYGYNCMKHAHNYYPPFLRENGDKVPLRNKPPKDDIHQQETGVGVAEVKLDYSPDFIENKALEFITAHKEAPFYLYYCPTLPHANNEGWVERDPSRQTPDGMEVDTYGEFEKYDWSPNEKGFARMVQRIDITVGKVVDHLKRLGIEKNTLILFSSDNGPHNEGGHSVTRFNSAAGFQGYKRSLHEGGIRIPFLAWWPGKISPGVNRSMRYFPDVLSTVCELAGVDLLPKTDGLSFAPTLLGKPQLQKEHEALYFEFQNQIAVRKHEWKYYRDEQGNESLYNLERDRHEDQDLKWQSSAVFDELKAHAFKEHTAYEAVAVPGGQVY